MPSRILTCLTCLLAAVLLWTCAAATEEPCLADYLGREIADVNIVAVVGEVDRVSVMRSVLTLPGKVLTLRDLRNTLQLIDRLEVYSNVQALGELLPDGRVRLVYRCGQRQLVRRVRIRGGYELFPVVLERGHVPITTIERAIPLRWGAPFTRAALDQTQEIILGLFRAEGYYQARVTVDQSWIEGRLCDILISIDPGPVTKLDSLTIRGLEHFPGQKATEAMWNREGRRFRYPRFERDIEEVRSHLRRRPSSWQRFVNRFTSRPRSFTVAETTFDPRQDVIYEPQSNTVTADFNVSGGERVRVEVKHRRLGWLRSRRLSQEGIYDILPTVQNFSADRDLIEEGVYRIRDLYRDEHYFDTQVSFTDHHPEEGEELDERQVSYEVREGRRIRVRELSFTGNTNQATRRLSRQVLSGKGLGKHRYFQEKTYRQDARAVEQFYRERGYHDMTAYHKEPEFGPDGVRLGIDVVEGPRYYATSVTVEAGELPAYPKTLALAEKPNAYLQSKYLRADTEALTAWFKEHGAKDVKVRPEFDLTLPPVEKPADGNATVAGSALPEVSPKHGVPVVYRVENQQVYKVGVVLITGLGRTRRSVVERELVFRSGERYQYRKVLESQRRLYSLGIFDSVALRAVPRPGEPELLDVIVNVREARTGTVEMGLGYFEQEGVNTLFSITYGNLWGRDRTISLLVRNNDLNDRQEVTFEEPYLFGTRFRASLTFFLERDREEAYISREQGLAFNLTRYFGLAHRLVLGYRYSDLRNRKTIEIPGERASDIISSLTGQYFFDGRDNQFDPKKGLSFGVRGEHAAKWLGTKHEFSKLSTHVTLYTPLSQHVLVLSARTGWGQNLPLDEKYQIGTPFLRGYQKRDLGPYAVTIGGTGVRYIGGDLFAVGNIEYRYRWTKWVGTAIFVDGGGVFRSLEEVLLRDFRVNTGLGLIIQTPLGPLRVDYGVKLDHRDSDKRIGEFSFSIGHTF